MLALLGWTGLDPAMTLYDAVAHAFSVVALGGFSSYNQSTAVFAPVTQYVLLVLMLIAGINFLRLYRVFVQRHFRILGRDEELRLYLAFAVVGSALITLELLAGGFASGEEAFRHGTFQAVSVMTTTGFGTADSTAWGALATMTLLLLMFIGPSAGSTGGSIKVIRHLLLFKMVRRELEQTIHREAVVPIRASGVPVEERALRSAVVFVLLYILTFALGTLALLIDARARRHRARPCSRRSARARRASATSAPRSGSPGRSAPTSRSATSRPASSPCSCGSAGSRSSRSRCCSAATTGALDCLRGPPRPLGSRPWEPDVRGSRSW